MVNLKDSGLAKKITNFSLLLTITMLCLFSSTLAVEHSKNLNILDSEKSNISRVEDITNLEELETRLFEKKENSIIVFYADWCHHW